MKWFRLHKLYLSISAFCAVGCAFSSIAIAQQGPTNLNISGALFSSNGEAITNSSVAFQIEVLDKSGTCVLYSEQHPAQNLSSTKGAFSLIVGGGTSPINNLEGGANFDSKLFQNTGTVLAFTGCPGGLTLNAGDTRLIRVSYNLGAGLVTMSPDVPITSSAYAMVAESLQGKSAADFILTNTNTSLKQANLENVFTTPNYTSLMALLSGSSTQYIPSTPTSAVGFNAQRLTNVANPTAAQDAATKIYADSNLGGRAVDTTGVGATMGDGDTLVWNQAQNKWVVSATGAVGLVGTGTGLLGGPITASGTLSVDVGTAANQILQLNTSGQIPAVNGSLLTNVNAMALQSRTLSAAAPTPGQVIAWNNTTSVWEPTSPAGGTISALTGDVTASGNGSVTATIANNAVNSNKINTTGVAVNRLLITDASTGTNVGYASCPTPGEVLQWSATGWACQTVATVLGTSGVTAGAYGSSTQVAQVTVDTTGRVTALSNINIAFPVLSVAGKTGVVTLNAADITGLGSAATQAYGVAPGDLVQLNGSAGLPAVDGSLLTNVNATTLQGTSVSATAPSSGQVLTYNNTTLQWDAENNSAGAGAFINGGNSFGSASSLGNKDAYALNFMTNNSTAMTVSSSGNVGIGTSAPGSLLSVGASSQFTVDSSGIVSANAFRQAIGGGPSVLNSLVYENTPDSNLYTPSGGSSANPPGITQWLTNTEPTVGSASSIAFGGGLGASAYVAGVQPASGFAEALTFGQQTSASSYTERMRIDTTGNVGIGTTSPTAALQLKAGVATAGGAPLKLTAGANLTAPEPGAIEFDGTNLAFTDNTNARHVLSAAGAAVTSVSVATANGLSGTSSGGNTPALTLSTSVNGLAKGNGTGFSAATAGTDYSAGTSALGTGILKSTTATGALTIAVAADFPPLNQNTTGTASNVTGTVAIANGGTGQITQQAAINALAGSQASAKFLRGDGTNVTMSSIQVADVPVLNQSTTGTAGGLSSTLAVTSGGTGQAGALTADGVVYASSATAMATTAAGTSGQVLTSNGAGSAPTWQAAGGGVASGVSATNGTAAAPSISFSSDTGTGWWIPAPGMMAASTAGTERMRIDNLGNVGIGTTLPAGTLDVEGGTAVSGNGTSINLVAQNGQASGNTNGGNINLIPGGANSLGTAGVVNLANFIRASPSSLSIGASLNAGTALNVRSFNFAPSNISGANLTTEWGVAFDSITPANGTAGQVQSTFFGTPWLQASNANVTTTNASNVTIQGPIAAGNNETFTNAYSLWIQSSTATIGGSATNAYGIYANAPQSAANNYAAVFMGGNVGIGTTSPVSALDINGSVRLAMDTTGCASGYAGAIRYNAGTIEYCNGAIWGALGGGSGGGALTGAINEIAGSSTMPSYSFTGDSNTGIYHDSVGVIGISNSGVESMKLSSSGITSMGAMTVAAGGTNQNLNLDSSGTGSVNFGTGNGTALSVLDAGGADANYITIAGATAGNKPTIGSAGSDANISISVTPKGTGGLKLTNGNFSVPSGTISAGGSPNATSGIYDGSSVSLQPFSASALNGIYDGQYIGMFLNTFTDSTGSAYGERTYVEWGSGSAYGSLVGMQGQAFGGASGSTITNVIGVNGIAGDPSLSGNAMTNAYGGQFTVAANTSAVTNAYGGNFSVTHNIAGSGIANAYGVYVGPVQGTTAYGIYDSSGQNDYFSGKVGIGTAAPQTPLSINANTVIQTPNANSLLQLSGADNSSVAMTIDAFGGTASWENPYFTMRRARGTSTSPSMPLAGDNLGYIQSQGWISAGNYHDASDIVVATTENWSGSAQGSEIYMTVTTTGGTTGVEPLQLSSKGVYVFPPNAGTMASSQLEVGSTSYLPSWTTTGSNLAVDAGTNTDTTGSGTITLRAANSFGIPTLAASNSETITNAANVYIAGPPAAGGNTTLTNSDSLYVAAGNSYFGGNVGIGTTTPGAALDVNGTINARGPVQMQQAYMEYSGSLATGSQTVSALTINNFTIAISSATNITLPAPSTLPTNGVWNVIFIVSNTSGSTQTFTTTAGGGALLWDSNSAPLVPVGVPNNTLTEFVCTITQALSATICSVAAQ